MRGLKRGKQTGFTLLELVVALAIGGVVVATASAAIYPVIQGTNTSAQMTAVRQVQTAGYWVTKDGLRAEHVTVGGDCMLAIERTDMDDYTHEVCYSLADMAEGSMKKLLREETVSDQAGPISEETMTVCQYIDADGTSVEWDETLITLTVSSVVQGARGPKSATRTYEIMPRPQES